MHSAIRHLCYTGVPVSLLSLPTPHTSRQADKPRLPFRPLQSIMKNYDLDMDGYISREDFNKIAGNFPFSFYTHESDRYHNRHSMMLLKTLCLPRDRHQASALYVHICIAETNNLHPFTGREKSVVRRLCPIS